MHVCLSDGTYTLSSHLKSIPAFVFPSNTFLHSPNHFFISIPLRFPNRKPISTYALIDSGATSSCISDRFAERHGLTRRFLDIPIPIMAVDDCLIASGLITQDVLTNVCVSSHLEIHSLSVVSVGYPVILGLDWLHYHNPLIDWADGHLMLNCCGLTNSVTVKAKGYGLSPSTSMSSVNSTTALGSGYGLKGVDSDSISGSSGSLLESTPMPHVSFLSSFVWLNGIGHTSPRLQPESITNTSLPSSPASDSSSQTPLNIKVVNARRFLKASKHEADQVCYLRFHDLKSL
jgi:Retroviral aspartyl protease